MRLYLIRHGETVDNIAGVYAGVKDSQLTVHGIEQTRKLGSYFATQNIYLTHIFCSPLIRTSKTAQAILDAQVAARKDDSVKSLTITKDANLIEQDFGFYEGKPFYARQSPMKSGRRSHAESHVDEPGFVDVESKESMGRRADAFLDQHLFPTIYGQAGVDLTIAIVSHGILLGNLWRRMLFRIPNRSITIAPEVTAARGSLILEHLGGWSNAGYLELDFRAVNQLPIALQDSQSTNVAETILALQEQSTTAAKSGNVLTRDVQATETLDELAETTKLAESTAAIIQPSEEQIPESMQERHHSTNDTRQQVKTFAGYQVTILAVDSKQHLTGLKRQRGGIGRLAHDESQKKLTSFFKKPKTS